MDYVEFSQKIEKIIPNNWDMSEEETLFMIKNNKEFGRSLDAYVDLKEKPSIQLKSIDKKFLFLRDIAGIETLVMNKHKKSNDEFSKHSAWLLGSNYEQLEIIQNHLGTLYTVRNNIIHSLKIPYYDENFKRFFNSDFNKAIEYANRYHQLILLRYIKNKNKIESTDNWIQKLRNFKKTQVLEIPESLYHTTILKEIEDLTHIKLHKDERVYKYFKLLPKEQRYFIGLNTYGGLSTPVHKLIGNYEDFYLNNDFIIPDEQIWKDICRNLCQEIRIIRQKPFNEILLIPKTHLSLLFYLGYKLGRISKPPLLTSFKNALMAIKTSEEFLDPSNYWQIKKIGLIKKSKEINMILNITRYLEEFVDGNLVNLNLENFPVIEISYDNVETKRKVDSHSIATKDDIYDACRALERLMVEEKEFAGVEKVHLFFRAPAPMAIILGKHFRYLKLQVYLYEYGKKDPEQEEKEYFRVIRCR